jgi:hypothetical protein
LLLTLWNSSFRLAFLVPSLTTWNRFDCTTNPSLILWGPLRSEVVILSSAKSVVEESCTAFWLGCCSLGFVVIEEKRSWRHLDRYHWWNVEKVLLPSAHHSHFPFGGGTNFGACWFLYVSLCVSHKIDFVKKREWKVYKMSLYRVCIADCSSVGPYAALVEFGAEGAASHAGP